MSLDDKEMKQMVDSINQGQFQNNDQYSYNFDRDKNIINDFKSTSHTIHIGQAFNIDPMAAVVSEIENDKITIIDEIQIWSSNTNEMIDEIKNRYPNKTKIHRYCSDFCYLSVARSYFCCDVEIW